MTGEIAIILSLISVVIALRAGKLEETKFVTAAYKEFGKELEEKLDALEKKYEDAKSRIAFLERALTAAHKKIDRLMRMIKDLIKQLVDANIKPVHTLEELEDKE